MSHYPLAPSSEKHEYHSLHFSIEMLDIVEDNKNEKKKIENRARSAR